MLMFSIPANATTPFAGNNSVENITQTTLSIEMIEGKVIIEKSRGEGSLMEQDTIEKVS